jgi:hypothetical protein
LKFGQPFVIAGAVGSLQALRDAGYRVFDGLIDNSYDTIVDNTQRWSAVKGAIAKIKSQNMHSWYLKCRPDLEHNQQLYTQRTKPTLDQLINRLSYRP